MAFSAFLAIYAEKCRSHGDIAQLSSIKASILKVPLNVDVLDLCLKDEDLHDGDVLCMAEFLVEVCQYEAVKAVDITFDACATHVSPTSMCTLLLAPGSKLSRVSLNRCRMEKAVLRVIFQCGLPAVALTFGYCSLRRLDMTGVFNRLESLSIEHSSAITSLSNTCFQSMPRLVKLSLCGTSILNLWTTSHALLKLPCLRELRFQRFVCCDSTSSCTHTFIAMLNERAAEMVSIEEGAEMEYEFIDNESDSDTEVWSAYSSEQEEYDSESEIHETSFAPMDPEDSLLLKYINRSSICYERFYREFMITALPKLQVLDNTQVSQVEREGARDLFVENFESLPYNRKLKRNVMEMFKSREIGGRRLRLPCDRVPIGICRTLSASRVASSVWPSSSTIYGPSKSNADISRRLRPRQFEYHPTDPSLMVVGTQQGELAVINHEDDRLVSFVSTTNTHNHVLGLSWLNKDPDMFVAGFDNGVLELYSLTQLRTNTKRGSSAVHKYADFEQITSVHVNSTDDMFLASGYSKDVALYDVRRAMQLMLFENLHQEHINVAKFSNRSPSVFATSSFDKDVKVWDLRTDMRRPLYTATSNLGNLMVCFSPDDYYLLSSAVDNEVRQYLAVDGRLHMKFDIAPINSRHNYTRSYYMNGRDYVISGSCEENLVRVCCAQTGRRLRDLTLEGGGTNSSLYVQSLRADPLKDFHMCILVAYNHPQQKSELVKVNMLAPQRELSKAVSFFQSTGTEGGA